jgi:hypothetical protein
MIFNTHMGFFDIFKRHPNYDQERPQNSFENVTPKQMAAHVAKTRYGAFQLTEAIRPAYDLAVVPREGYRHCKTTVPSINGPTIEIPVIIAAASREKLLDIFRDLIEPLGEDVDLVLETSHDRTQLEHEDLRREGIDLPILQSVLFDFEDVLLDDGYSGIAVIHPDLPLEIQLDEHKLLAIFGEELSEFEDILESHGVRCDEQIRFISEADHVHVSSEELEQRFQEFRSRLGLDD